MAQNLHTTKQNLHSTRRRAGGRAQLERTGSDMKMEIAGDHYGSAHGWIGGGGVAYIV